MLLGAHISIEGGVHKVPERARELSCNAVQIFTKNQIQWYVPTLSEHEIREFKTGLVRNNIKIAFAHATYLINLASPSRRLYLKSIKHAILEVERSYALGLVYYIMHPGCAKNDTIENAIKRVIKAINNVLKDTQQVIILLETTSGQGTSIGGRFEHLREVIDGCSNPERIGVCVDTCHIFSSGYDIRTPGAYCSTIEEIDKLTGIEKIKVIHFNDSFAPLASRIDRHAHIGKGYIGTKGFACFINDKNFYNVPMIIETPKEDNMDMKNLKLLRRLKKDAGSS